MIYSLTNPDKLAVAVKAQMEGLNLGFNAHNWLANPKHLALTDGKNVGLFERSGETWNAHTVFESRGKEALSVGKQMLEIMFDRYGARVIKGLTPVHCRAARFFNRMLGFKSFGIIDTINGPQELFILEHP